MATMKKVGVLRDSATRWGKDAFMKYRGCVAFIATEGLDGAQGIVIVSHDHRFIDQVCSRVVNVGEEAPA